MKDQERRGGRSRISVIVTSGDLSEGRRSMRELSSLPNRRQLLAATAAAGALSLLPAGLANAAEGDAIRPFTFHASQTALDELRRRIAATRWPEKETVADSSQGVPLATMQDLARYWATARSEERR